MNYLIREMIDLSSSYLPDKFFFYICKRKFFIIIKIYMHWSYIFAYWLIDIKIFIFIMLVWWLFMRIVTLKCYFLVWIGFMCMFGVWVL